MSSFVSSGASSKLQTQIIEYYIRLSNVSLHIYALIPYSLKLFNLVVKLLAMSDLNYSEKFSSTNFETIATMQRTNTCVQITHSRLK